MAATLQRRPAAGNKLDHILSCATRIFCEKGYEGASIRDLSRRSGVSLAGLYYYFDSKEELLYLIQKHCFTTLLARLEEELGSAPRNPEARLRRLIRNHLGYFLQNPEAMKVLSHEADSLTSPYARQVADIKRSYYRICRSILDDLKRQRKLRRLNTRLAVMSLYGMMNWIYTWYKPRLDPDADALADHMSDLFLGGILAGASGSARWPRSRNGRRRTLAA
jgi:AcrR family transcriptional regulator